MKKIIIFMILCFYVVMSILTANADGLKRTDVYLHGNDWLGLGESEKFFYLAGFFNGYYSLATEVLINYHSNIRVSREFQKELLDAITAYGYNKNFTWWTDVIDGFYRRHKKYGSIETRHMIALAVESYIDKITPNIVTKRLESLLKDRVGDNYGIAPAFDGKEPVEMEVRQVEIVEIIKRIPVSVGGASWNQAMSYGGKTAYVIGFLNGYASVFELIEAGKDRRIKISQIMYEKMEMWRFKNAYSSSHPDAEWWVETIDGLYGQNRRYVVIQPDVMISCAVNISEKFKSDEEIVRVLEFFLE